MLYKSATMTSASGSAGGVTASRNRYGSYFRGRAIPVNPNTSLQQVARTAFKVASSAWNSILTDTQRQGWSTLAANTPMKNKLGDTVYITGNAMFAKINSPRVNAGEAMVLDAPTTYTATAVWTITADIELDGSGVPLLVVRCTTNATLIDGEFAAKCYTSIAMSPTINFFKGPFQLGATAFNSGNQMVLTVSMPGLVAGQRVYARVVTAGIDGSQGNSSILPVDMGASPLSYNPYGFAHNPYTATGPTGTEGDATNTFTTGEITDVLLDVPIAGVSVVRDENSIDLSWLATVPIGVYSTNINITGNQGPFALPMVLTVTAAAAAIAKAKAK
jgi:hypothetical protein